MKATASIERRRHPRKRVELDVAVLKGEEADGRYLFTVHDISLSGMAIFSEAYLPAVGECLTLCLSEKQETCSPDHVIEATVVRQDDGLAGIRFDSVGIHILKDIQRLLRDERNF